MESIAFDPTTSLYLKNSMRIPPIEVLLSWPKPNYVDPATRGPASLIVEIVFLLLAITAVSLRFYCRISIKRWCGLDDRMIALALASLPPSLPRLMCADSQELFATILTVAVILAFLKHGWNRHEWDIPLDKIEGANIIAFIAKLTFVLAATCTRLSLCCFYYRLVRDTGITWFKWVVHGCTALTVITCVAFILLGVFLCM